MSKFWKINFYINVILLISYLFFLYWDIQIKKGNSSLGDIILYLLILCCCHFLFQILSFIVRLIKKKNNKYGFMVAFLTFSFIVVQFIILFVTFSSTSISDW